MCRWGIPALFPKPCFFINTICESTRSSPPNKQWSVAAAVGPALWDWCVSASARMSLQKWASRIDWRICCVMERGEEAYGIWVFGACFGGYWWVLGGSIVAHSYAVSFQLSSIILYKWKYKSSPLTEAIFLVLFEESGAYATFSFICVNSESSIFKYFLCQALKNKFWVSFSSFSSPWVFILSENSHNQLLRNVCSHPTTQLRPVDRPPSLNFVVHSVVPP